MWKVFRQFSTSSRQTQLLRAGPGPGAGRLGSQPKLTDGGCVLGPQPQSPGVEVCANSPAPGSPALRALHDRRVSGSPAAAPSSRDQPRQSPEPSLSHGV